MPPSPNNTDAPRIVFVNGDFLPAEQATVSVFDRGFLFGDGVYEVTSVLEGRMVDNAAHMQRLRRSLEALSLPSPMPIEDIPAMQRELIARNKFREGGLYLQITRGPAERSFDWPGAPEPSLVAFTQAKPLIDNPAARAGISVALVPDLRWKRRDIKTIALLPASWAKAQAAALGADDAWMVETGPDGVERVTEGSSNNAFIVLGGDAEGAGATIVTRKLGEEILHGVTRRAVLRLAEQLNVTVDERGFTPQEAAVAREAFITSASAFVTPVTRIDDRPVGSGAPGPIATRLREVYIEEALREAE